jgi:hypothetical protein
METITCSCDKHFIYACIAYVFIFTTSLILGLVHDVNQQILHFQPDVQYLFKATVSGFFDLIMTVFFWCIIILILSLIQHLSNFKFL